MFTKGFATGIIAPSAAGQPFFVAGPVEWNARVIGAHPVLLNGLFASIQLALGLGFLFRRSARLAIVTFGHMGRRGLVSGRGTRWSWQRHHCTAREPRVRLCSTWFWRWRPGPDHNIFRPVEDSVRRSGLPIGSCGSGHSCGSASAVLSVLPSNSSARSISSELRTNASMVPLWLAAPDRWVASAVHTAGFGAIVFTVAVESAVGLLVLGGGTLRTAALWAGMAVAVIYWAVGPELRAAVQWSGH